MDFGTELGGQPLLDASGDGESADDDYSYDDVSKSEAGMVSSMASITNAVLGAGILALPFAFARSGSLGGIVLVCWSALLNVVTMHLLSAACRRISATSGRPATFRSICARICGQGLDWVVDAIVVVMMLGLASSYLMIFSSLLSKSAPLGSRRAWVGVGAAVVSPLAFAKTLDALKFTSTLAMCLMLYVACVVVAFRRPCSERHCGAHEHAEKVDLRTLEALALTTFAYTAQTQLVGVTNELRNYTQAKMDCVICAAIGLCCAIYCVVGSFGYDAFGDRVQADLLASYPGHKPPVLAARLAVASVLLFSYPLMTLPCRASLLDLLARQKSTAPKPEQQQPDSSSQPSGRLVTLGILVFTTSLALLVDDLGVVLSVIGSTASTAIAYVVPAAAYLATFPLHQDDSDDAFPAGPSRRAGGTRAAATRGPDDPFSQPPRLATKRLAANFILFYGIVTVPLCLAATFINS